MYEDRREQCEIAQIDLEGSILDAFFVHPQRNRDFAIPQFPELSVQSLSLAPYMSTRYYGSKRRQLGWLKDEFSRISGNTALDAFGGTGAVSHLLAMQGWETTYNDVFRFNTVSARAVFIRSSIPISEAEFVIFLSKVCPCEGFISENFKGMFFTDFENRWLDGFMKSLSLAESSCTDLLLHCLFQACLKKRPFNLFHRANLNLRQASMPVKFGNRATWERSFTEHMVVAFREVRALQRSMMPAVHVTSGMPVEHSPVGFDLVYMDPPYFKRAKKTDTYLTRYHFLEGLARYEQWPHLIDKNSPIKALLPASVAEWSSGKCMVASIRNLFARHPNSKFVLSYVSGEQPSEDELFSLFKERFGKVRLSKKFFGRALSKKKACEIILVGQ